MEMWQHLRAILLLPFMATVVIPAVILYLTGLDSLDLWQTLPATRFVLPVFSLLFIGIGLVLMVATIRLFATVGKGTLAPWKPTQKLVVQGVYRHVRNPMISGVMAILVGEAIMSASLPLVCWFLVFVVANAIYIPVAEEPGLVKRFGQDYEEYRRNVPRWIPRMKPWNG
jgi:protein-S-isoprenylcysteine O-methyltransferase Ste14